MSKLIGIEIDDECLRLAQLDGTEIKSVVRRLPEDLVVNDEIVSFETLAKLIKEVKKEAKISGRDCAIIMPENSAYFRTINMPPVSVAQLKLNLPYEFRDFVGNDSLNYNFDYAVDSLETDENGKCVNMHLFAAAGSKKTIESYIQLLKKAHLKLKTALPREMAIMNLVKSFPNSAETEVCLVDVGYSGTIVYIVSGGKIAATKTIDIGCRNIDDVISATKGIDVYLAASYRETDYDGCLSDGMCDDIYDRIAREVLMAINFYRYENPESELQQITFVGNGAPIQPLTERICSTVSLEQANVAEYLPGRSAEEENLPRTALALGVAL